MKFITEKKNTDGYAYKYKLHIRFFNNFKFVIDLYQTEP